VSSKATDATLNAYAGGMSVLSNVMDGVASGLDKAGGFMEKIEEKMPNTMNMFCAADPTCVGQKVQEQEQSYDYLRIPDA
jgi:hypothetical protein